MEGLGLWDLDWALGPMFADSGAHIARVEDRRIEGLVGSARKCFPGEGHKCATVTILNPKPEAPKPLNQKHLRATTCKGGNVLLPRLKAHPFQGTMS